jgi:hypothetical protein
MAARLLRFLSNPILICIQGCMHFIWRHLRNHPLPGPNFCTHFFFEMGSGWHQKFHSKRSLSGRDRDAIVVLEKVGTIHQEGFSHGNEEHIVILLGLWLVVVYIVVFGFQKALIICSKRDMGSQDD